MIKSAEYLGEHCLEITFKDGTVRDVDLFDLINSSDHPLVRKYLDVELFKQFYLDGHTICWGDNEFDIDPLRTYKGEYDIVHVHA